MQDYASLALVEQKSTGDLAIWAISVATTSAELSGAWVLNGASLNTYHQIVKDKLLIEDSPFTPI